MATIYVDHRDNLSVSSEDEEQNEKANSGPRSAVVRLVGGTEAANAAKAAEPGRKGHRQNSEELDLFAADAAAMRKQSPRRYLNHQPSQAK